MLGTVFDFARVSKPLQDKLDSTLTKKKDKKTAAKISIDLNEYEKDSFDQMKKLI